MYKVGSVEHILQMEKVISSHNGERPMSEQIGGDHYKTGGTQHWDLMHPAYLLGCASKYVFRHHKKGGREDLEKAIHYCEKFQETSASLEWYVSNDALLDWAVDSNMDLSDYTILYYMLCVKNTGKAIELIKKRITECYPQPVPLTEENHYAERVIDKLKKSKIGYSGEFHYTELKKTT